MKYLEVPQILKTSQILKNFEETNTKVSFQLETYKCKFTRKEKQLFDYKDMLTYLKNSLGLSFPNYDFSKLSREDFRKTSISTFKEDVSFRIGNVLGIFSEVDIFVNSLCKVFDLAIDLERSEIYMLGRRWGPFEGCAWFFCYLFYNKRRKRVLLFAAQLKKT